MTRRTIPNKEWFIEEYTNKKRSMSNIATEIGVQNSTIWNWLEKYDIKRRKLKYPELYNEDWLRNQYEVLEKSALQIEHEQNAKKGTITRCLKKYGIKIRHTHAGKFNSRYGSTMKPETKEKIRIANKGKQSPNKGKHLSEETKQKISLANKGKLTGDKNPAKRPDVREKIRANAPMKNKETRDKVSKAKMGKPRPDMIGEKNSHWNGGVSFGKYCPKWTKELRERIRAFFEYRCICCGKHENELTRKLSCHHVQYDKNACCTEKRPCFAAMCNKHHTKTNSDRVRWEKMIMRIIDEMYNGKTYLTKEEMKTLEEAMK